MSAPGYLLDAAAEQQLAQDVAQALEESRWQGSLPGGATPAQARREAKLIRRSSQDWAQNQGLAGLQLESEEYLFVRLSGQEEAASVFHYRRAAAKPLRILSLEDSTEPSLLSEALAKVIQAIRHSSARVSRSNHLPPLAWGWAGLGHFLEQLRRGCEEALSRLSSLPAPHFAIERLECDLSYSSYRRPKRQSSRDPLLAASEWIHTSVQATAEPPQGVFHLVLRSPEFVLSGETRQWFLRHLLSAAPAIRHTLGGAYLERALCDPEVQQEALILLAGTPKSSPPRFLIAWPHQGKERVLFCRSDGSRLHEVELIQGFEPQRAGPEQQRSLQRALAGWFRALQFWRAQRGGV
ncbi:MAG: hypothetical protein NZV14_06165 [Bryobacteraceae bacterium]|nr:hypothetical protein [Bryobacteraceae bacterium]MDW8377726.1 hypothetical protein [Bryobacterales bacterium]